MAEQLVIMSQEDKREAPPLTLENVFEAMKRAVKSWMWLVVFLGLDSKLDAITHQHDSEARLKAVIEAFLLGEGTYQPSWRRVIHVLHQTGESQVAHDIESYAEAMQDPTLTVDKVTQVFNKIEGDKSKVMGELGIGIIPDSVIEEIERRSSTDREKNKAYANYYVNYHPYASWEGLTVRLYVKNELAAARESKSFMSTDPTLTVDNVSLLMKKVEPKQKQHVWEDVIGDSDVAVKIKIKSHNDLERDTAYYVDVYVNCDPYSSWEELAGQLYRHQQVAAVEEVKSYLPPRDLTITTDKLMDQFESVNPRKVDYIGDWLGLPQSERDKIKKNYRSPTQRKEAYLDLYAHQHPCPSWREIAWVLRNVFSLHQQADLVDNTYVKVSEKTQQCFDSAMVEGEVSLRNGSVLLIGPGGSGKSHFLAAVLEEDPPSARESTPCAKKPIRAVAHCKVGVNKERFVRITEDHYSDMLVATAERLPESSNATTAKSATKSETIKEDCDLNGLASSSSPTENEPTKSELPVGRFREETWCVRRAMKRQFLGRMQAGLKKKSDLNDKDILDLSDTAGQSMFHEILPLFITNTMCGMLTVKLNERLDAHPLMEYFIKGEPVGEPFPSPFTHFETIHLCMRAVKSTCKRETCPMIAFIGTHKDVKDECPDEDREAKEEKIRSIIPPKMEDNIVTIGESMLLAVNAKEPGDEDKEVISILRKKMREELQKLKPSKIPLRYIPLEMAFQRMAKEQGKSVLSKEECFQVAATYNFTRDSFEAALKYLHSLKLIFYYEDVLPDVVFIDAQALLDKITELVVHMLSLHAKPNRKLLGALKKFKMHGVVTMDILSEFNSHYVPNLFERKELMKLFKYLRIMAEVGEGECLMACLLKKEELACPMPGMSSEAVPALLFYFGPDGAMLGVYCFLLASLITDAGWKLLEEGGYPVQLSRNRARFVLPGKNPGCVTITDSFSTFFHVAIEPPEGASADRVRQICKEVCPIVLETILTGIRKASQKLNYTESIPEVTFPCLKHEATSLHPATISSTGLLTCTTHPRICSEMTEGHHLWFGHKGKMNKADQITDTDRLFKDLGLEICKNYKEIGLELGLGSKVLTNELETGIFMMLQGSKKATKMLQLWRDSVKEEECTYSVLAAALEKHGFQRVANKYCYSQDSSSQAGSTAGSETSPHSATGEVSDTTIQVQDGQNCSTAALQQTQQPTTDESTSQDQDRSLAATTVSPQSSSSLSIADLCTVLRAVWAAREKWYYVGLELGASSDTLDSINIKCREDPDKCVTAMIKGWLNKGKPPPSWTALAEALSSPMVGCASIAQELPAHTASPVSSSGPVKRMLSRSTNSETQDAPLPKKKRIESKED